MTASVTCRRLPTAKELADRLGVDPVNVGPVREPFAGMAGTVDVVVDGQLTRFALVVDHHARWPQRRVEISIPAADRRRREQQRLADLEAERERQADRERQWRANHYRALDRMAERAVRERVSTTGCVPLWSVVASAIDRERDRQVLTASVKGGVGEARLSATATAALGLDTRIPEHLKRHASVGICLLCGGITHGERLCHDCAADFDVRELT